MSITGLCQLCENAEASNQCQRCASLVCDRHYNTEVTVCVECASQSQSGRESPDSGSGTQSNYRM